MLNTHLLGISGPSSSGKTTLSRILRDILPNSFILHLDDFYYTDEDIPIHNGVQDWDCLESLNLPAFRSTLQYIKAHGGPPPELESKEDQNAVGESGVKPEVIEQCRIRVKKWNLDKQTKIAIIDGFLLFSNEIHDIRSMFDVKLFLRTTYELTKKRREARKGYVTLEGFWEDPPDYVDKIVWPNYVRDHRFLFEGGDVEGELDREVCYEAGVNGMPLEYGEDMNALLKWAVNTIEQEVKRRIASG